MNLLVSYFREDRAWTGPDSITVKKQNRVTEIATENNLPIVALVQSVS